MEQEYIIEANKKFAEFMDHDKEYIKDTESYGSYHEDPDWLMPIVEKIWSMGYFGEIYRTEDGQNGMFISHADWINDIEQTGDSLMEAVYKTVLAFIEWYNSVQRDRLSK